MPSHLQLDDRHPFKMVAIGDKRPSNPNHKPVKLSEEMQRVGMRLALQLEMRNFDRCHEIVRRFEAELKSTEAATIEALLEMPICEVVDVREANALETVGIHTLGQAVMCDDDTLLAIPNFGERALASLKDAANRILGR
jgi:Bacterial RNA polymerase, alpha chain C terminal domain